MNPRGWYSQQNWGCAAHFSKPLILFKTTIFDIPYPIYDLNKHLMLYLRPALKSTL